MRYRKLDANGDYVFGHQQADFYRDQAEAVAQAVQTRLGMTLGEWFLDVTDGMPWNTEVLGKYTKDQYDGAIRDRILGTEGVTEITSYASTPNTQARTLSVIATINTQYGQIALSATI
ncbi:hypothetical protein SAMD00023378_3885 [Ralstonia sp. NT80]|uniref:hypothetical protein n=1 Tax=Ralstonia sp. NT80 TaxID=1218247 RepID=UPI00066CE0F2|nr:hypothetical protein [Ralstonia sp. NT80]GAQ30202.1 hypothetical protein SAMD00023378_3885 [Ralstonia sp. NT80]